MSGSLVENMVQAMGPTVIGQIGKQLGLDPNTTQSAINVAMPLIVSAMANNTQSAQGAQSLSNALQRDHDGSILNNLPRTLPVAAEQHGDGILKHVLGDQRPVVEQALSKQTGVDASALLQMVAPVVMGVLGQQQRQQNLGATGVATMLQNEQQQLSQGNNLVGSLLTAMLDQNHDGSIIDDAAGMLFKLMTQRR